MSPIHKDERREGYAQLPESFFRDMEKHILEENALFKSLRIAGGIFSTLIVVITWIFIEKNNDIKAMQLTLNQHALQINETLVVVKTMVEEQQRHRLAIDRNSDDLRARK